MGFDGQVLAGRVALITGANRGIGRSISRAFGEAGASTVVTARSQEEAMEVAEEIRAQGGIADAFSCDVADEASVVELRRAVEAEVGPVEVVVANAGIAGPTRMMHEISLDEWQRCLEVDLDGVFLTFREFIPRMIQTRKGSLIAISSVTGKRPLRGRTPYAAAKMGVIGLVRTLAEELGEFGIRANTVCPGAVSGRRIDEVIAEQALSLGVSEEEVRRRLAEPASLRRFAEAEEIAAACVFLASPLSSAITGEDLNVSAGLVMY